MAALNFVDLAAPVSAKQPCGPDLEEDLDFQNVTARLEVALPTSFFRRDDEGRQIAFDRASIDFAAAFSDIGKLLARARDIRLLTLAAKLAVLSRDLPSFCACLGLVAGLLDEHWDEVHPRPEDGDPILRDIALQGLDDMATIVLPLQHAPLVTSRRIGPLAFRSQLVATGETRLVEGEQHPDASAIQAALADVDIADLTAARDHARSIGEALARIAAVWAEKTPGQSLSWPRLQALSGQITTFLDAAVARRVPGQTVSSGGSAGSGPGSALPAQAMDFDASCASVAQVRESLAACLGYFCKAEPSSPSVLLIGQAQQLIGKSLYEVIQIMFPDHVDKAAIEVGQAVRFPLPLERLASFGAGDGGFDAEADDGTEDEAPSDKTSPDDPSPDEGGSDPAPRESGAVARPVATRAEAVARMNAVARFYRQAEPSHPTPLLMDKACALAQQDFLSLMADILPEVGVRPDNGN